MYNETEVIYTVLNDNDKLSINVLFYATYINDMRNGKAEPFFALVMNKLYENRITDEQGLRDGLVDAVEFFDVNNINKIYFKPIYTGEESTPKYANNKYQLEAAKEWIKSQIDANHGDITKQDITRKYETFIKIIDEFSKELTTTSNYTRRKLGQ